MTAQTGLCFGVSEIGTQRDNRRRCPITVLVVVPFLTPIPRNIVDEQGVEETHKKHHCKWMLRLGHAAGVNLCPEGEGGGGKCVEIKALSLPRSTRDSLGLCSRGYSLCVLTNHHPDRAFPNPASSCRRFKPYRSLGSSSPPLPARTET